MASTREFGVTKEFAEKIACTLIAYGEYRVPRNPTGYYTQTRDAAERLCQKGFIIHAYNTKDFIVYKDNPCQSIIRHPGLSPYVSELNRHARQLEKLQLENQELETHRLQNERRFSIMSWLKGKDWL